MEWIVNYADEDEEVIAQIPVSLQGIWWRQLVEELMRF